MRTIYLPHESRAVRRWVFSRPISSLLTMRCNDPSHLPGIKCLQHCITERTSASSTTMELDASYRSAVFDLPIESMAAHVTSYLRATSRASDLQKVILSTSQHALERVYSSSINAYEPAMPTDMEVDDCTYTEQQTILDLPIESLTHVASYLTTSSRALFTVALALAHVDSSRKIPCTNAWLQYEQNALSADTIRTLTGYQWDTLDFGDLENDLASRLSDHDVHAVLIIIDAANRLRTLKLSHCTNITGSCLEPLRGSVVLEKIDLSLVGDNESPKISPAPLSFDHVLPILDSIIQKGSNRLTHIQFPHMSRAIALGKYPGSSEFRQFVTRYNDMFKKRVIGCSNSKCNANINACGSNAWMHSNRWMHIFGIQFNTCYGCTRHYCDDCASKVLVDEKGRVDIQMLAFCAHCQKYYCADCKRMERCQVGIGCDKYVCFDCDFMNECSGCNWKMCGDCFSERRGGSRCNKMAAFCDFCE